MPTVQPFSATAPVKALAGTAAEPSITFTSDTDTGLYSPGANQVAIATGGVQRLLIGSDGSITPASPLRFPLGTASSPSISFTGDTNTGIYSPGADQVAISTGGSGRLFVDASGNVGVGGTPGVYTKLAVNGNIYGADGSQFGWVTAFANAPTDFIDGSQSSNYIRFFTNNNERLRITSAGLVGVGTSSPTENLTIYGNSSRFSVTGLTGSSAILLGNQNSSGANNPSVIEAANGALYFGGGNSWSGGGTFDYTMTLTNDNKVGIGTTSPAQALSVVGNIIADGSAASQYVASSKAGVTSTYLMTDANGGNIQTDGAWPIRFTSNSTERARIDSSGRLLVGTSSSSVSATIVAQGNSAGATSRGILYLSLGANNPADGTALGNIEFSDSTPGRAATISAARDGGTWTAGSSHPGRLVFSTTADGAASPTERLRITSAGLVGIGTSSPSVRLEVIDSIAGGSDNTIATLHNFSDTGGDTRYAGLNFRIGSDNGTSAIRAFRTNSANNYETNLSFWTNPSGATQTPVQRMTLDSTGRLGIGTTSPGSLLHLAQSAADAVVRIDGGSSNTSFIDFRIAGSNKSYVGLGGLTGGSNNDLINYNSSAGNWIAYTNGTERLRITSAGLVGIGTSAPLTPLAVSGGITGGNTAVTNAEIAFPSAQANAYLRLLGNYQVGAGRGGTIQLGGKSFSDSGTISSFLISAESADNSTNALTFSTQTAFNNSIVERMRLTATGLGIGTTTVNRELVLYKDAGPAFHLQNSTSGTGQFDGLALSTSGADATMWNYENGFLRFGTNDTERARIDSSGRLLVGTSASVSTFGVAPRLQVAGGESYQSNIAYRADAFAPFISVGHSRSATVGAQTILQSGDDFGTFAFVGSDGTGLIRGAQISAAVDGTPGANDMPGRLVFSTTADGAASPTERMRITSAGLVGIGTSSPGAPLDTRGFATYRGNVYTIASFCANNTNVPLNIVQGIDGTHPSISAGQNSTGTWGALGFVTSEQYRMLITSAGNVGIGTSSPGGKLQINVQDGFLFDVGAGAYAYMRFGSQGAGEGVAELASDRANGKVLLKTGITGSTLNTRLELDGSGATIINNQSGTERARIDSSGRLLVGTSSSPSAGLGQYALLAVQGYAGGATGAGTITIQRGLTAASGGITANEQIAVVGFTDSNGNEFANIQCLADGSVAANDMPGRLVFSTTADGASSPTERLRIDSAGQIEAGSLGTAAAPVWTFLSDPNTGIYSPGADQVAISTAGSGRLFVDASGNVGINTTSGTSYGMNLAVVGTIGLIPSTFDTVGSSVFIKSQLGASGGEEIIRNEITSFANGSNYGTATIFSTRNGVSASERLRITSAGLVGVGTSSPSDKFEIANGTTDAANALGIRSGRYLNASQEGAQLKYYSDNTSSWLGTREVARIGAYGLNSDHRIGSLAFAIKTTNSASDPTEMMRLTPTGLGVGTTSPDELLTVASGTDRVGVNVSGTVSTLLIGNRNPATSCSSISFDRGDGSLRFNNGITGAITERARIDSSGRLGIGTSSPAGKTEIVSSGSESTLILRNSSSNLSTYSELKFAPFTGTTAASAAIRAEYYTNNFSSLAFRTTNSTSEPSTKLFIDGSGNVGIGTTSPNGLLDVRSATTWIGDGATDAFLQFNQSATATNRWHIGTGSSNALIFYKGTYGSGSETARIDSSGRLLVGTSSARANLFNSTVAVPLQVEGTGTTTAGISVISNPGAVAGNSAVVVLGKTRSSSVGGTTVVASGDELGVLTFQGSDGSELVEGARISCEVDGTPGANDMPGRLVFRTTADGASSPTERMRITSAGAIGLSGANYGTSGQALISSGSAAPPTWGSVSVNVQEFTTSGTWTKPSGAKMVYVEVIAGGGGGTSGLKTNAVSSEGGAGGAGGMALTRWIPASTLGATISVTVGAGGTGYPGRTIAGDDWGASANAGGNSSFGTVVIALGGSGAAGPYTSGAGAGSEGGQGRALYVNTVEGVYMGNARGGNGITGAADNGQFGYSNPEGPGGGGAGGGMRADGFQRGGGTGGGGFVAYDATNWDNPVYHGGGGTAGSAGGGAGGTGATPGDGGGGGGASRLTSGGNGAAGTFPGGGGGGGGSTHTGASSGAGGNGANGVVRVYTYF